MVKRAFVVVLALTLVVALVVSLGGCQRKVSVLTGEIVVCTAGEILEDNTEEIQVPEDELAEYGVTTKVTTCDKHSDLAELYEAAQKAIAVGDLVTARERLETLVDRDPAYRNAKQQLAEINKGATPQTDSGQQTNNGGDAPTGETPAETPPPQGPVVSLMKYVPDTLTGYVAQGILADPASLSRQYLPVGGSASQLVIEVEQRVDAGAATLEQQRIASAYPQSQSTRTVNGRTVMAGVNGPYAIAVFTDGAITVAVELHGSSGASLVDAAFAVVESISK